MPALFQYTVYAHVLLHKYLYFEFLAYLLEGPLGLVLWLALLRKDFVKFILPDKRVIRKRVPQAYFDLKKAFNTMKEEAEDEGFRQALENLYLIGGMVRNIINRTHTSDIDLYLSDMKYFKFIPRIRQELASLLGKDADDIRCIDPEDWLFGKPEFSINRVLIKPGTNEVIELARGAAHDLLNMRLRLVAENLSRMGVKVSQEELAVLNDDVVGGIEDIFGIYFVNYLKERAMRFVKEGYRPVEGFPEELFREVILTHKPDDFDEIVDRFYRCRVSPASKATKVEAAEIVAEEAYKYDTERGGWLALDDRPAEGGIPELIAAVFGRSVKKDIKTIKEFFSRHFGREISVKDAGRVLAVMQGTGIGGQRNTTGMLTELARLFPNRFIYLYSAFGAPFEGTTKFVLGKLNEYHGNLSTPRERLDLLKERKEQVKLFNRAASKSGTTPETMVGFQRQVKEAMRLYSMFVYGTEQGRRFADEAIAKIYDGENLLTGGKSIDALNDKERMMLAIVLDRVILATGEYRTEAREEVDGRARTGGSRFDCFAKAVAGKLEKEFTELGIKGVSEVRLYDRFGGRTQLLGPDAFINIAMALYDGQTEVIAKIVEAVRPQAVRYNNLRDRDLFGKKLAALALDSGAEFMYIGLPTGIQRRIVDGLQQLIGESIDVGALVGHALGIKPVVCTTTVLADKSRFKKDDGLRLYVIITDKLADKATKEAEGEIIEREQAKGNTVVRIQIRDHSPAEFAKLYYAMLNFVEWYGNFATSQVLANLCVNFDDKDVADTLASLYSKKPLSANEPGYYSDLRKIVLNLNVWFQPGVEWGKTAARKVAEKLFVRNPETDKNKIIDPVTGGELSVPVRDNEIREQFYAEQRQKLEENKGAYIIDGKMYRTVGRVYKGYNINTDDTPGISVNEKYALTDVLARIEAILKLRQEQHSLYDTVDEQNRLKLQQRRKRHDELQLKIAEETSLLQEISGQLACNEKTAKQLALVAYQAHQRGKSVAVSLYAGRQRFEALGEFAKTLDIFDTFQHATDKQHTDADGDVAGTKTAFQILAHVREPQGERVSVDGMVAPYWNDLSDQDILMVDHRAYKDVYKERQIDHVDLRLKASNLQDIVKIYVLFARANRIYLELNKQADAEDTSNANPSKAFLKELPCDELG
ncbi:MAG: hypothetical protein JRI96_16765, partial [Deltaproteobacteria bacterium]|nr:hypothetical protein [Deltaproteobacteria bacterium]